MFHMEVNMNECLMSLKVLLLQKVCSQQMVEIISKII